MNAKVEMVYGDPTKNKMIFVEVKAGLKGLRLMNAIEKAVEKKMADDKDWTRWNLLSVE